MKKSKSIYNLIASLTYKIGTCVIGLLIPRLFVMSYGSELNGLQTSITQIFAYISLIEAGVGDATVQSLFGPISRKDYDKANSVLSATTYYYKKIGVVYFIILTALSLLYPLFIKVESVSFLTIFLYIIFSGLTTGINFFYQAKILLVLYAEGDVYINSMITTLTYFLSSVIKIVCILNGLNIVAIQIGYFLINLLGTAIYFCIAKKKYPWINFHVKPDIEAISQKDSVLLHKISGIVFQNTDIIILTFFCDLKVVSIYTMYKLVINMITTIIASFGDSFNHILGQTFNGPERDKYDNVIDTFNVYYSSLAFGLFTVTSILILPFLKLYTAGMDINYIFPLLPYFYIGIEVLQVGREAMMRTITVAGHFKKTLYATIIEMCINLFVSITAVIICKKYWGDVAGLYGVLLGTIVALLYRTLDINRYANKKILNRGSFKTNKVMITNIVLYIIVSLIVSRFEMTIDNYFSFVLHGVVITPVVIIYYLFIQSALNINEAKRVTKFLKRKKSA